MRLPLNWLKEFVSVRLSPEKLAERLTLSGSEVDKIERGPTLDGVVVGEVLNVEKHPNADRLKVCKVSLGAGAPRTIVCGAPNVATGQRVAVAQPGTTLPNGLKLEKSTIRGVASEGMICAADELGIGSDHTGIIVLSSKAKLGTPAGSWLGVDTVLDLEITPNRGDCLSIRGLAREVAAQTGQLVKTPGLKFVEAKEKNSVKVKIIDRTACSQYITRVVTGITIKPSPAEIQQRLQSVGVRPINAVVDATNYVMFELGQPLHAFDANKVKQVVVRQAKPNEKIITLDGVSRALQSADILITDGKQPIALAGVMGGRDTEVTDSTTSVLIESARFDPIRVRATAQRLSLRSEASSRFEKGIDPAVTIEAVDRVAAYITQWCSGSVLKGRSLAGGSANKPKAIRLSLSEVERLLGVRTPASKVKSILQSLGCQVSGTKLTFVVKPPTWRIDLTLPADLVEEVGRMLDYNSLPKTLPTVEQRPNPQPLLYRLQTDIRDRLVAAGLTEISTYSFYSHALAEQFDLADQPHSKLANPLNPDQALMRRSLMPLLLTVAGQQSSQREQLSIFEIGRAFWPRQASSGLPEDRLMLGMVWVAKVGDPFLNLKGTIGDLFHNLGIQDARIVPSTSRSARIVVGTEPVGIIGWVGERYARAAKLRRPAAFCEIDCSLLSIQPKQIIKVKSLPLYPSVERDLAFVLPKPVPHHELVRAVRNVDPLILNVQGFDRYRLPDGRTSIALRLTFQSPGKTLTGSEVQDIVDRVAVAVKSSFQAEIRS